MSTQPTSSHFSGSVTMRWQSKHASVCFRSDFTTGGPMVRLGTKCPSCVRSGLLFFFYVGAYPQLLYVRHAHDTRGYPARNCSSVNTTEKISRTTDHAQGVVNRAVFSQRNFREGNPIHRLWLRHQTPETLLTQAEALCKRSTSRSDISYQTYQQKSVRYYEQ